jgi:hypothetical protein
MRLLEMLLCSRVMGSDHPTFLSTSMVTASVKLRQFNYTLRFLSIYDYFVIYWKLVLIYLLGRACLSRIHIHYIYF